MKIFACFGRQNESGSYGFDFEAGQIGYDFANLLGFAIAASSSWFEDA